MNGDRQLLILGGTLVKESRHRSTSLHGYTYEECSALF